MSGGYPTGNSLLKHASMQLAAGGSAGCVEVLIMHPLDLIKTRFQIQSNVSTTVSTQQYTGIRDCMLKMYRQEGLLSFWKGLLPPLLVETPKRAWKFFTFEQFQKMFLFGKEKPGALTYSMAGLASGATEAIIVNPFEVVKVKMQSDHSHYAGTPSTWGIARNIINEDGLGRNGLLGKGITATIGRNGLFNMVYFGFYHTIKNWFPEAEDRRLEFLRKVSIGLTAGTLGCCVNIPFDVAKSRIQGPQPEKGIIKYRGTFKVIAMVYKEEGFLALYKGIVPKIMRLGPGGALMLLVYENVYGHLQRRFPD